MSNIHQALGHLFATIDNLEAVAGRQEQKIQQIQKTHQQDLFNGRASTKSNVVDITALAGKLDGAIEKIEQVLREG